MVETNQTEFNTSPLARLQEQRKQLRLSSLLLLLFTISLAISTPILGSFLYSEIQTLEGNIAFTNNIINDSIRTISQVQWELHHLVELLEEGSDDYEALEAQRARIEQGILNVTDSYLRQSSQDSNNELLMNQIRIITSHWEDDITPLLDRILANQTDDDSSLRAEAIVWLRDLELDFNQMVMDRELARIDQAEVVNNDTIEVLANQRTLIIVLGIFLVLFLSVMAVTAVLYYRFNKQREAIAAELVTLNAETKILSQVARHTDNLVIILNEQGLIEWVNDAFEKVTGYVLAEVIGQQPLTLLQGPETDRQTLARISNRLNRGQSCTGCQSFAYGKDGRKFWMSLEMLSIQNDANEVTNFIAIMTDLTEQRERALTIDRNAQLLDVINKVQNEFILSSRPGIMFETLLNSLLEITESEYGFIGEVLHSPEGTPYLKTQAITNIAWNETTQAMYDQQAANGMVFDNLHTLFGAALTSREPVIANHPASDARSGKTPPGHPDMNSFLGVPFFNARQVMVGMIGIANRPGGYDAALVGFLRPFLATCGNLVEAYRNEKRRQSAEETLVQLNKELEKRTEEVAEERDFALQIMENMGQGLTVVNEDGRFTYVNPAYARMVHEDPQNLIGRSPLEFAHPEDLKHIDIAKTKRSKGKISTYEMRIQPKSGGVIDVMVTGVPRLRQGEYTGSIAVVTDLTEQKQVEAALRTSEAEAKKLSHVASRTDNMVIVSDAAGNIEWVNTAFSRITGFSLAEVVGQRPGGMLQGPETDPATVAFMRKRLQEGKGFKTEVINYAKNGRPYWVAIEVQPVHNQQGVLTNFIALETDITERRLAEQQLREAKEAAEKAASAKTAFLASMSHEIRTPLNAVIGLNSLLLNTDLTKKQRQFAETARSSGNLLLMLVNNVLDYSALESGRVELEKRPFELKRCLQDVIDLLQQDADQKMVAIHSYIDSAVPPVLIGDDTRLRQVLLNLIKNGIKFTEVGSIEIRVSLLSQQDSVTLQFSIQDTGIGIPQERLKRLFRPFTQIDTSTTRKYGGTGLGLAICKTIVTMMGGDINVSSVPGVGTTFTFTVQLEAGDPDTILLVQPEKSFDQEMGKQWPLRILLAEDDTVNQQVAERMLDQLGYQADIVENGIEVLDALERQKYDVIFMDIHMPEMDGLTTTRRIHELWPKNEIPKIIAMTASALEGDRERFMESGMDDYISKPVLLEAIASTLAKIIHPTSGTGKLFLPATGRLTAEAPIDEATFIQRMGTGQEQLLRKLVDLFLSETARTLPALEKAVKDGSASKVRELAHHLKGSGAGVSAVKFSTIAHKLEMLASKDDLAQASTLFEKLVKENDRVINWQIGLPEGSG